MTMLSIVAGMLIAALGLWILVELQKAGRSVIPLIICTPLLMAWPIGIYLYGSSLLGYAVSAQGDGIEVVYAFSDSKTQTVYIVGLANGRYRLYQMTDNFSDDSKAAAKAQDATTRGQTLLLDLSKGKPQFYALPPENLPPKN